MLTAENLSRYLTAGDPFYSVPSAIARQDPRTGIAIGVGRTAERSKIYTAEFRRMLPGRSLLLDVDGLDDYLESWDTLRLGGESRSASYRRLPKDHPTVDALEGILKSPAAPVRDTIRRTGRFKLYLATPAVFDNGWYPDFLDHDLTTGEKALKDGMPPVQLVSAAVGKPTSVSGWNMKAENGGDPRPTRLAAPAGSVYYFIWNRKIGDAEIAVATLIEQLHGKALSSYGSEIGFGLGMLGGWQPTLT